MKKRRELLSRHHSIPTSRGGTDQSVVLLPQRFHQAFHFLFQNLTPDEIHLFLEIILEPGTSWTRSELNDLIEEIKLDSEEDLEVN